MRHLLRLSVLAAVLAAPFALGSPAAAAGPASPYEEVAAARDGTTARAARRTSRPQATAQRRHRQAATRTRRARATQG
jgi:hypothetical protein